MSPPLSLALWASGVLPRVEIKARLDLLSSPHSAPDSAPAPPLVQILLLPPALSYPFCLKLCSSNSSQFSIMPPSPHSAPAPPPFPILLLLQLHLLLFLLILVLLLLLLRCCSLFLLKTLSRGNYCSDRSPVYEVIVGVAGPYELGVAEDLHRSIKSGHITIASVLPSVEEGHSTAGLGDQ